MFTPEGISFIEHDPKKTWAFFGEDVYVPSRAQGFKKAHMCPKSWMNTPGLFTHIQKHNIVQLVWAKLERKIH